MGMTYENSEFKKVSKNRFFEKEGGKERMKDKGLNDKELLGN
jgi:hypothetical protein